MRPGLGQHFTFRICGSPVALQDRVAGRNRCCEESLSSAQTVFHYHGRMTLNQREPEMATNRPTVLRYSRDETKAGVDAAGK